MLISTFYLLLTNKTKQKLKRLQKKKEERQDIQAKISY